jgi:hypothetical protein
MVHSFSTLQPIWFDGVGDDEDDVTAAFDSAAPPPVDANGFTIGASTDDDANDE